MTPLKHVQWKTFRGENSIYTYNRYLSKESHRTYDVNSQVKEITIENLFILILAANKLAEVRSWEKD